MNFRQIEIFRAVMQTGSFTGAAQSLHVSQPGISRAVRHLEIQLGVSLFERAQGRVKPTDEAVALHGEIERSYRGVQSIRQFAGALKFGTYAMLRVACSPNLSAQVVPRAAAALLASMPSASVSLEVLSRPQQLTDAIISREVDVAISASPLDNPMLEARLVGHWQLVCLMGAGHALAGMSTIAPADVKQEQIVAFPADTVPGRMMAEWFQQEGVPISPRALVRSGQMAASLVANGVGIAFVDSLTATAAQASGLQWRPLRKSYSVAVHAVWNRGHAPSQQARLLTELVQRELRDVESILRTSRRRTSSTRT